MEWGSFEGVIGPGYGEGPVIVWDRGTYENLREGESMRDGLGAGRLRFDRGGDNAWLLAKLDDDHAVHGSNIVDERPESVDSGRRIEDLAS